MPTGSDLPFLVLHALRLKGFADVPAVAALADIDADEARGSLDELVAAGLATHREGRISGWALSPAGRTRHAELLAAETKQSKATAAVDGCYRRFLEINHELLAVCTDWQLRDGALNDHTDAGYDDTVVKRLRAIDDSVQPVCTDLAAALPRFATYGPRLAVAVDKVEDGERDWFAKPMIDSYHTVWFELHEDLLVTLGIERSKEGS